MNSFDKVEVIELFHVAFLDVLAKRVDRARYVLKGGANLRFFFNSLRYSEDIDLDLCGEQPWRLQEKVDALLAGGPLHLVLRAAGLRIAEVSPHKQTETSQRWKVAIEHAAGTVRTKIEFSNRGDLDPRRRVDVIPQRIVSPHALRAPAVQHYVDDAPAGQKIAALAYRSETQARDIFDLDLLLRQRQLAVGVVDPELLGKAAEIALHLPYGVFEDQVLPFLEQDARELYEGPEAWEAIQIFVADSLERAR